MYKKVYIEITNICNLKCPFCYGNKRKENVMKMDDFLVILNKLKGYTNYLYLHVLGEPLLHPYINEFINEASNRDYKINITTNGYFIKRIKDNKNIRQINISLHSYQKNNNKSLDLYMKDILMSVDKLKENTYISYRLWTKSVYKDQIIKILEKHYNVTITGHQKLTKNVFIEFEHEFIWPNLNRNLNLKKGRCKALKDHIAILNDGTVVPCCLDGGGLINLGNILTQDLKNIINSDRYQKIKQGFKNNKKEEKLCWNCDFFVYL